MTFHLYSTIPKTREIISGFQIGPIRDAFRTFDWREIRENLKGLGPILVKV